MDAYSLVSRSYDAVLEPLNAPLRRAARRVCPADPAWVVLDAGCGTGAGLAEYAADGCTVIGTDTSESMLARSRAALGPEADLRLITDDVLPVQDGCADLVVISLVLHSIPHDRAVALLREAARALAPGGRILVTDFGTVPLRFPRGHLTRALTTVAEVVAGPRHAANAWGYLRSGGLPRLVDEAGLAFASQRPAGGGNITIAVLQPRDAA